MDPSELVKLCEILNPHNKSGKLTIITRMGAENMRIKFPHLIRAVKQADLIVTWVSDPMHGNTMKAPCGLKTRSFDAIRGFLRCSRARREPPRRGAFGDDRVECHKVYRWIKGGYFR